MNTVVKTENVMSFDFNPHIPEKYKHEIRKAVYLLKNEGARKIYLFGSMVTGNIHARSDIDIGIKGIPKGKFLKAYSQLLFNLNIEFDLVNFDFDYELFNFLKSIGEAVEVG